MFEAEELPDIVADATDNVTEYLQAALLLLKKNDVGYTVPDVIAIAALIQQETHHLAFPIAVEDVDGDEAVH
jgi:hypothetical protein